VLCIPSAKYEKRKFPSINVLGHKRKQNVVASVGGFNFPVVYKSVTAISQKAEIELAVSLC